MVHEANIRLSGSFYFEFTLGMHDNLDIKKACRRFSIKSFSLVMVAKVGNQLFEEEGS